jgi:hypothetical protein
MLQHGDRTSRLPVQPQPSEPPPYHVANVLDVVAEYAAAGEVSDTINNLLEVVNWDRVDPSALRTALTLILSSVPAADVATVSAVADVERSVLVEHRSRAAHQAAP